MCPWTRNCSREKDQPLRTLPLLPLRSRWPPLPLQTYPAPAVPPHAPLNLPSFRSRGLYPVPGCLPRAAPALLQPSMRMGRRGGQRSTRAFPTSASLSWCPPVLSATCQASFSPTAPAATSLLPACSAPQHLTTQRGRAPPPSLLHATAPPAPHKVSFYTLTGINSFSPPIMIKCVDVEATNDTVPG